MNRRHWIEMAAAGLCSSPVARPAPGGRVSVARCPDYGPELLPAMKRMFDQIGGLGALVKGKTVAVKINLTGRPTYRLGHYPLGVTHYTHPAVIGAAVHLLGRAGARRIRLLECPFSTAEPLEEVMLQANWEPRDFLSAAAGVEFENTNWLGRGKSYTRFPVPRGGHMFKAFDLNHSYQDCDVFVSLAKMKQHGTAGVTLAMKNCFGITPCTIYGSGSPENEPGDVPRGGRSMFHTARGRLPRAAHCSGPGGRAPGAPFDRRGHPDHDRRRGAVDREAVGGGEPRRHRCGHQLRSHGCRLHGSDGIRPDGGSRRAAVAHLFTRPGA